MFHPIAVLAVSLGATLAFVALVLWQPGYTGQERAFQVAYNAPIVFVFAAYLLDRAERWRAIRPRQRIVELVVVGLAMARAAAPVPLISGHALFLTYVLLTTPRRLAWWSAALALVEVSYLKIAIWRDATLIGGAVVGLLAAWAGEPAWAKWLKGKTQDGKR